jgi:asparagine synthase (glutamine-hydrolysing)
MCGLFAYYSPFNHMELPFQVDPVLAALKRRGPDGFGALHLAKCSLLHTRLAILDPEHGQQPMRHTPTGVAIAYNGEIYNSPQLRETLEKRGHTFRTSTDTEVVLAAFAEYGEACVSKFEGMFAFAIWDPSEQCLFIARDRLGEKPLYFAHLQSGAVMVSSEIKALVAAGLETTISGHAIDHYLEWKYTPADRSIYNEIEILPPAHYMKFQGTKRSCNRYWQIPPSDTVRMTAKQAVENLHQLLSVSVSNRLRSDRNVGIFLSGGIDSTILAALATTQTDMRLASFTVAYDAGFDESRRAAAIAHELGTDHTTLPVAGFAPEDLENICAYFDQPHADSASLAQALLTQCASEHVQVVLSGDGADELFCGYRWYDQSANLEQRQSQMRIFPKALRQKLLQHRFEPDHRAVETSASAFEAVNNFDLSHYLGGQLLPKADMTGMAFGVEVRSPFLDYRIVEFARSLPTAIKVGEQNKPLLRELHRQILPNISPQRQKQGFGPPLQAYLSQPRFRAYVLERLGQGARIRKFLEEAELDRQIMPLVVGLDRQSAYRIWVLLCLELWASRLFPGQSIG